MSALQKFCRGCRRHKAPEGFVGTGVYARCEKCVQAKAKALAALRPQPRPAA